MFNTIYTWNDNYAFSFVHCFTHSAPSSLQDKYVSFIHQSRHLLLWTEIEKLLHMFKFIMCITCLYDNSFIGYSCIIVCRLGHTAKILIMGS